MLCGRTVALMLCVVVLLISCGDGASPRLTFSGSAVGREGAVIAAQLQRFAAMHPDVRVEQRVTPDAADQRHQLYVQWLNAGSPDPDVLQIDVIWMAEFAGAGWILPAPGGEEDAGDFLQAALSASTWRGVRYAVPWFVDVGLLYWRTDLVDRAPESLGELRASSAGPRASGAARYGLVWQGARYEGLLTVFLEHLHAMGGVMLDQRGAVAVDSDAAVRALVFMRDAIDAGFVPRSVLAWQEEQTRFAFQNGDAVFMRNWPYAASLLRDAGSSRVAGRFAVAPFPAGPGGSPAASLGGALLAVNARSDHAPLAWELVRYLTAPSQMIERAVEASQLPARLSLYDDPSVVEALPLPAAVLVDVLRRSVARPATPVYAELSEILQVAVHRALSGQQSPEEALRVAAQGMRALLARSGLTPPGAAE